MDLCCSLQETSYWKINRVRSVSGSITEESGNVVWAAEKEPRKTLCQGEHASKIKLSNSNNNGKIIIYKYKSPEQDLCKWSRRSSNICVSQVEDDKNNLGVYFKTYLLFFLVVFMVGCSCVTDFVQNKILCQCWVEFNTLRSVEEINNSQTIRSN